VIFIFVRILKMQGDMNV